ncbi:hypothetical protein G6F24_017110 [Rhizopus arrhizus]|nr:hypothetical protein G6F24_017110 [Rhizopus arrhizus]
MQTRKITSLSSTTPTESGIPTGRARQLSWCRRRVTSPMLSTRDLGAWWCSGAPRPTLHVHPAGTVPSCASPSCSRPSSHNDLARRQHAGAALPADAAGVPVTPAR